jgi:hypothetical protein
MMAIFASIIVVAIIVIVVVLFVFVLKGAIVGKWMLDSEKMTSTYTAQGNGEWYEFKGDGTLTTGGGNITSPLSAKWKDVGGGKIEVTQTIGSVSATITMNYKINGNILTLSYSIDTGISSSSIEMTFHKA